LYNNDLASLNISTPKILNTEIANGKTLDLFLKRYCTTGIVFTGLALYSTRSMWMVHGGNENQFNESQKASIIRIDNNPISGISVAVNGTSGSFNHILITNSTGYSLPISAIIVNDFSYGIT
jgi:hypothetical protein